MFYMICYSKAFLDNFDHSDLDDMVNIVDIVQGFFDFDLKNCIS